MHKRGFVSWSIFLLMTTIFLLRTAILHHEDRKSTSPSSSSSSLNAVFSNGIEHFKNSNKKAHPLWSYSTFYDDDDNRLQEYGAVLTDLYEKHAKFLWVEVGVMLFAPHLGMHKIFASPSMRTVFRQQSHVLRQQSRTAMTHGKRVAVAIAKAIRSVYKNRSKYSTLSDYTWYFTIEEEEKKAPLPRTIDLYLNGLSRK